MKNGDGLRVVLWLSGCDHACPGCQNPITWDPAGGLPFDAAAREELFTLLSRDYISGLTLSGGDPLYQGNRQELLQLLQEVRTRFPGQTIWLYTGYLWEEIRDLPHMDYIDVCVDGPFLEKMKDNLLCWKGSKNQRVIDVPASLSAYRQKGADAPVSIHCPDYYQVYEKGTTAHATSCTF